MSRRAKQPAAPRESDLYPPLRAWLEGQGYTVRSEVAHCDITAVKDDDLIIIEMKQRLSVALLAQGAERQRRADSVYLAVPVSRALDTQWKAVRRLLRRLELGLLTIDPARQAVRVRLHPEPYEPKKARSYRRALLTEFNGRSGEFNEGGSSGRKLVTAYRENAVFIACCIEAHGPSTAKQLRALGTGPKTHSVLYKNVYGWFRRVERGVYDLTPTGRQDLIRYDAVAATYRPDLRASA